MRDRSSFLVRLQRAYPIKAPQGRTTNDALLNGYELATRTTEKPITLIIHGNVFVISAQRSSSRG